MTTGVVTTSYYLGGQLVANRVGTTLTYIHQDSLNSTSVMSTSTGTLDSSIAYFPFGSTRTGSVNTTKKFTGQRLDGTGLYYYNARYYDATIGRFISADTVGIKQNNPQTLNRYTYCFNNPLTFNDPTGQWPDFTGIYKAVVNTVKVAVNTAVNKGKEVVDQAKITVENAKDKANEVQQAVVKKADQTVDSIITHAENAVGIESISTMNTSLVKDVPVINVIQDSPLDNALFFTNGQATIYPIGVFTKKPMDPTTQEEEGYHWNDQKNSNSVAGWDADYIAQYGMNLALYGGNDFVAYNAVSYERDAKSYAAAQTGSTYTPPPSVIDYWWDEIFGP